MSENFSGNSAGRRKKIGILGGTFNPIHYGHLIIAENACCQFELDQVIFLPTGHSPHKQFTGEDMTAHRSRMVELAVEDNPRFSVSYREVDSGEISYTYRTLESLKEHSPDTDFYFILGADSLFDFDTWRHPERICQSAVLLAAVRAGLKGEAFDRQIEHLRTTYGGTVYRLDTPNFDVSSREIRERAACGRTIRYLLPQKTEDYIHEHNLYK